MTLVVADTGPLRYLILIEAVTVLARLYDRVILPRAVYEELTHRRAPEPVRRWAQALPRWAEVKTPTRQDAADFLDPGEAEAIALAIELGATALLLDENEAREEALRLGLPVAGTVGILEKAAEQNLLDLKPALERLMSTNFRIDVAILSDALERDAKRRSGSPR